MHLFDRGRISVGQVADVVAFDPATVADKATFAEPKQLSVGIRHVIVNGAPVVVDGVGSGARPGRVVRRAT